MKQKEIDSKIKKLIALGTSPNKNEAVSAIRKAIRLMKKYKIVWGEMSEGELGELNKKETLQEKMSCDVWA